VAGIVNIVKKQFFSPRRNGFYELFKQIIPAYFVKQCDVIFDVGAYIGRYTFCFSDIVGRNGKVFAYEPHPQIFSRLEKRCKRYSNISCRNFAVSKVSNQSVEMKIYPDATHECATVEPILMGIERMPGKTENIFVQTRKLDDHLNSIVPGSCGLIKIDVEGHEHAVIDGAANLILRDSPIVIYEYGFVKGSFEPRTIVKMEQLGYVSYDCKTLDQVSDGYIVSGYTDLIAIPKTRQAEFEQLVLLLKS